LVKIPFCRHTAIAYCQKSIIKHLWLCCSPIPLLCCSPISLLSFPTYVQYVNAGLALTSRCRRVCMNFFNCVGCSKISKFVNNIKNPSPFIFAGLQSKFHNTLICVCSVLGNRTHVLAYILEHNACRELFILYGKPLRRRVCRWGTEHCCQVTISERMLERKILLFLCTASFRKKFPSD